MQHATVNRFCAIEGVECHRSVPYCGRDTFFFAYPSGRQWRDFSLQLVNELGDQGILIDRWEDLVNNELLFAKVCDGIYGHDFLLAEVTEANPNVLLEIGYALAVGRQPVLLKNKNLKEWNRTLLTTLEGCYYDTRDAILQHILNLQARRREIPDSPDRRLPFLEKMGIYESIEDPGTVYHLKPKLAADWISRVDKTLGSSFFKLTKMDPSDSVYDEFYPQARGIQRASLIVASLVSQQHERWEEHNANVALLIGFAIGLGKQVLVLQQEPIASILDLGSVARPFETESQAGQIVHAWIDTQTRLSVNRTTEAQSIARARRRSHQIRDIYLGHPDALQDTSLLDYFVPTKEYEDAVAGRRSIFVGRRGTGKSANFQAIKETLRDQPAVVTVEIAPDDFELDIISAYLDLEYAVSNPKLVFRNTWNYILLTEILKALAERTDLLYVSPNDLSRSNLFQYYQNQQDVLNLDFGSRVIATMNQDMPAFPNAPSAKQWARGNPTVDALRDYNVSRHLKQFASQEKIKYFVVIDDLDKNWRPDTQQSINLLLGLVSEADRLQRYFDGDLNVAMFLREDIFDVLSQHDEDLPKRNYLRLEWTKANLKHLVAERLLMGIDDFDGDDDAIWGTIFPDQVNNTPTSDYILSRALPRPRDVLGLCQAAIDQAQRNGNNLVTIQDILDGETSFSDNFIRSVAAEFKDLYPKLHEVLIEFAGVPERMPWVDFRWYASNAIEKNQHITDEWVGPLPWDAEKLAGVLFRVGVIGLAGSGTDRPHFRNGRSFAETWNLVSPRPIVHIHEAFSKVLDVSHGGVRSLRGSRRALGADPRQLPLQ